MNEIKVNYEYIYQELDNLSKIEAELSNRTVKIHVEDNRGSAVDSLEIYYNKLVDIGGHLKNLISLTKQTLENACIKFQEGEKEASSQYNEIE